MHLQTVILSLLAISSARAKETEVVTITPISEVGVLYEDLGELLIYHNTWSILTEINLEEVDNQTQIAGFTEHLVHRMCPNGSSIYEACLSQKAHIHSIVENMKKRTQVVRELLPRARKTRSVFDGVGNVLHYLFGTMDSSNEREIYSRLSELENDRKALVELEKQQISVVKTTLEKFSKPLVTIMDKQAQIARRLNDLQNETDLVTAQQQRQEIMNLLILHILEIEHQQQRLLDTIIASQHNQLHPLLISPETLINIYLKTNPHCGETQKCLAIIYQTARTRSYLLQEKLVVRVEIPILDRNPFRYYQIYQYPIPYNLTHIVYPTVGYTHIAGNLDTGEFLLLTPENIQHFQRISYNLRDKTYVSRLNVPITKSVASDECAIRLLYNPLNETARCHYKILSATQNLLIKMNKPNTWLFSLTQPLDVHLACKQKFFTQRLIGPGVLSVNRPCQVQIGPKTLLYEAPDTHPLLYKQPPLFLPLSEITKGLQPSLNRPTTHQQNSLTFLTANEAHQIVTNGVHSLDEIQKRLDKLSQKPPKNIHLTLSTTSISLTGALITAALIYLLARYTWPRLINRTTKGRNRAPPCKTSEPETCTEENSTPNSEKARETPKPKPLHRAQSLPKPKALQIV